MRFCLVLLAVSGLATPALAQSVELAGDGVNLAVRLSAAPGADHASSPEVSSQADLTGQLSSLKTQLQLGVKTGEPAASPASAASGWWNSTSATVSAAWAPIDAARFELEAQNSRRIDFTAADPVFSDASQHYTESRQSGVTAAATLSPILGALPRMDLKLLANASSDVQQDAWIAGAGGQTGELTQTQTRQASAMLGVSPLPSVKVEAGGEVQSMDLIWPGGRAATEASVAPTAGLSVAPWSGGALKLTLVRTVTPLSADQFVGYGLGALDLANLQPSRAWRYGATLTQKAGSIDVTASLIEARMQSPSLSPVRAGGGPSGAGLGNRSEVSAELGAPLLLPGLLPLTLQAEATWRASTVEDPLTGALGRLSGERPYDASLSLSQTLGPSVRWGVTAVVSGPQTNLAPTQIASLSSTAGLGGFLQYTSKPVTVRLSLDNVLGGQRQERDVFYSGTRDLNQVDHLGETRTVDRGIRLSFSRAL